MNSRERLLSILLGSFIGVGVLGLVAYFAVISPYQDKTAAIEKLQGEVQEKTDKKESIEKGAKRYAELKLVSLPPEPNTAQREYDWVLTELLNRSGVPARSRTVNVKLPPDKTTIPLVNPGAVAKDKKYAYQRVTADITLTKVNLESLMRFLTAYQQLPLLQHVTKLSIKLSDSDANGSLARRGGVDRVRNDLSVTLSTEAIILDGMEQRESLVRIPRPVAALGGSALYFALDTNPETGRWLALHTVKRTLPTEQYPRDYLATVYKDPFHGTMPPPDRVYERGPPPLPPGIDQHIRVSAWTTNSDGSANVDITDMANNVTYKIHLSRKGEKLNTSVTKQRVVEEGKVVKFEIPGSETRSWENKPFTIADEAAWVPSSTKKTFTIHGLVPYGIILSAAAEDEKPAPPAVGGGRGGRGGGRGGFGGGPGGFGTPVVTKTGATSQRNAEAAISGAAVTHKFERYYVWTVGQTLRDVMHEEIPQNKVNDLLRNALAPLMPEPAATTPVASTTAEGR